MNALRSVVLVIVIGVVAACGSPSDPSPGGRPGGGGAPSDPQSPVTLTPEPGSSVHDLDGRPQRVRPMPGMTDLRPVVWERARQTPGGRQLRITYWSGVEPCNVLDHVDLRYQKRRITVTLYEGSDPEQPDAVCIEIALRKVVIVPLDETVGGRKLVDGAE